MNRNIIFSFSLERDSAELVHNLPHGKKSKMVSDAILWYNECNFQEVLSNISALQRIIREKDTRIRELENLLPAYLEERIHQSRPDRPRLEPRDQ